ncbi:MAG: hypothetical protein WC916_03530 [Candidatus Woesearchaeota archaeon]
MHANNNETDTRRKISATIEEAIKTYTIKFGPLLSERFLDFTIDCYELTHQKPHRTYNACEPVFIEEDKLYIIGKTSKEQLQTQGMDFSRVTKRGDLENSRLRFKLQPFKNYVFIVAINQTTCPHGTKEIIAEGDLPYGCHITTVETYR